MKNLKLDISNAISFLNEEVVNQTKVDVANAYQTLLAKNGAGNDFLGWLDLPLDYDKEEFARIQKAAAKIQAQSQVLLAIGICGSYLGAKSAIEMIKGYFTNKGVEVIFVGNHISSSYVHELIEYLKDKDYSINVISKSGTTT
ncbi:MAG: glucose-6-phosphate isomerase, partial [Acholeplasmatales bacterium]|nr:glucose-6-phosphate isomerase [Acholeplasmatales bacterium]